MKKLVPNPEYEKAKFALGYVVHNDISAMPENINALGDCGFVRSSPELRTNNPNYLTDGGKESDRIPSHIEVDE